MACFLAARTLCIRSHHKQDVSAALHITGELPRLEGVASTRPVRSRAHALQALFHRVCRSVAGPLGDVD